MKHMKNKILKLGAIAMVFIVFTSCEKWIDTDMNNDPNNPEKANYNAVLPSIEASLAYQFGGDISRPVAIWMQQYSGVGNQAIAYDVYNFTQSDVNNVWYYAMYSGPMADLSRMIKQAAVEGAPHYQGVAEVLMALSLGTMTDLFGDIPYSKAFDGDNEKFKPAFDSQESIYTSINKLLDDAIVHLGAAESLFSPGVEDLIYGGDLNLWIAAANTLKARYALHLSKVPGSDAYNKALVALANGFTSFSDDMQFAFGSKSNELNPAYQFFMNDRYGDIYMGAFFVDTLSGDPRFNSFVDTTGAADDPSIGVGSNPGMADGFAMPGPFYHSEDSPVPFITYAEVKFIEAEALLMTGNAAGAATAFNDAVTSSVKKVEDNLSKKQLKDSTRIANQAAWLAANASETAATITLGKIITQKYIALYTQPETFVDYRRTGYPQLTPAADAATVDKQIPRRWPYPTSERLYNADNFAPYKSVTISTPVWWDK
jgi:hypothetical protein